MHAVAMAMINGMSKEARAKYPGAASYEPPAYTPSEDAPLRIGTIDTELHYTPHYDVYLHTCGSWSAYLRNKNVRPLLQIAVALRIVLEIVVCPLNQGDTCVVDFEAAHEDRGIHECGSLN